MRAELVVPEAARDRDVVGVQEGAEADERVRLGVVERETHCGEVEHAVQHVVDVVTGSRLRTAEREGIARGRLGAAPGADEPAGGAVTAPPGRRCAR